MKIAIIGAGFCGLAAAWHLLNHEPAISKLKVHLFDTKGIGKGVSGMAAGLLHPYVGAHAKLNWRGQEGFKATQELLLVSSQALEHPVVACSQGILRVALNEAQESDFHICAELYPSDTQWLDPSACQALAPGCAYAPGLWLKQGLTVYSYHYLQGLWKACAAQGARFEQRSIHALKDLQNFDLIIVTAGAESHRLQELTSLPIRTLKGQVLELSWPTDIPPLTCALNSQIYILMTEKRNSCLVGATYEKGYSEAVTDINTAKQEILPKAYQLFPSLQKASIINCYAGMRAVTPQRRPFLKFIPPNCWVLTGMGSKGLLYHALFAKELVRELTQLQ